MLETMSFLFIIFQKTFFQWEIPPKKIDEFTDMNPPKQFIRARC
jgi:hypothetical protein